ncbi:MAG: ATP-grasp domain-containing protein [Thermoleophilia bacterium]|nr:ATP-grasp domain-containing protein [Thermoleophilia bacterium]
MKVIVLDCYSRMGLAVVNSLTRDWTLVGGTPGHGSRDQSRLAGYLRSSRLEAVFRYPPPVRDPAGFRASVAGACELHRADAVFPCTSATAVALARWRAEEPVPAPFVVEDDRKLSLLADKWLTIELCREVGVPTPASVLPGPGGEGLERLEPPLVVKPRVSEAARGIRFFGDREAARAFLAGAAAVGYDVPGESAYVVQSVVPGEIHGACACGQGGHPVSMLTNHRLLTKFEFGGNGLVHETTYEPEIIGYAERLMARLEWNGPVNFEFIRDRAGRYHMLEANPRLWGSTELAVAAGLNVPQQALEVLALGRPLVAQEGYSVGMRSRWLTLGSLAACLRRPRTPRQLGGRLWLLLGPYRGPAVSNVRRRNLRHLLGMAVENARGRRERARTRSTAGAAGAATLLAAALALLPASALGQGNTELLPDLHPTPPGKAAAVSPADGSGRTYLTFGVTVENTGTGPLVLSGHRDGLSQPAMTADQLIQLADGSTRTVPTVGTLTYDLERRRWGFGPGYLSYELRRVDDDAIVGTSPAVGFCLQDDVDLDTTALLPGEPAAAVYDGCGSGERNALTVQEGLSVGYGNRHVKNQSGQLVDITSLPDGEYVLVLRANVAGLVHESSLENNTSSTLLAVRRESGAALPTVETLRVCPNSDRCRPDEVVEATLRSARFSSSGSRRTLVVKLTLGERVRVTASLLRGSTVLAEEREILRAGRRSLRLPLASRAKGGKATLKLVFEDTADNTQILRQRVLVPAAG